MPAKDHHRAFCLTAEGEIRLRSEQGHRTLSLGEAFAIGDSMIRTRKYATAMRVFGTLSRRYPENLHVLMMLARCRAGWGDYEGCNDLLQFALGDVDYAFLVALQAAFFYESVGVWSDAVSTLKEAAERCQKMPLLGLLLGDYHLRRGDMQEAEQCWREVAFGGDQASGYIEFLARRRLERLAKWNSGSSGNRR